VYPSDPFEAPCTGGGGGGGGGSGEEGGGGSGTCTLYVMEESTDNGQTWTVIDAWWECN
jgi:hypothetical protein